MAKTANLYARIEPDLKQQAENILSTLGITASNAITLFYKQIILQKGLPFEVKIPAEKPIALQQLTDEELRHELELGLADVESGRVVPAEKVFEEMKREYGI